MPFVFGILGVLLVVSGVRGTVTGSKPNLVGLIKDDLTGQPNYTEWMVAIFAIGALGYVPQLKTFSRTMMTAVVVGLLLSNRGFFAQLEKEAVSNDTNVANPSTTNSSSPLSSLTQGLPSLTTAENTLHDLFNNEE
jgi:hypothetical protein